MEQVYINEILVDALLIGRNCVYISSKEARRLLKTGPKLQFIIYKGDKELTCLDDLDVYGSSSTYLTIRPIHFKGIKKTSEIECLFEDACLEAIDEIKKHLKRIIGFSDFDAATEEYEGCTDIVQELSYEQNCLLERAFTIANKSPDSFGFNGNVLVQILCDLEKIKGLVIRKLKETPASKEKTSKAQTLQELREKLKNIESSFEIMGSFHE